MKLSQLRLVALGAMAVGSLAAAGCGSDSNSNSNSNSNSSTSSSGGGGKSFTVGYSQGSEQNPFLAAIEQGAVKQIEAQGGKVVVRDTQLNPNKQVTDIREFINQKVDAIVFAPAIVPEALIPALKQAHDAGIPVIGWDWYFESDTPPPPVDGQVTVDRDKLGKEMADELDKQTGGKAQAIEVALPFPVRGVDRMFQAFDQELKTHSGSSVVKIVKNGKDNAEGALPLVGGALTSNSDANALVTYNGGSAEGGYQAAKQQGKKLFVLNAQVDPGSIAAQKAGQINEQWELDPVVMGSELGKLASAAGQDKPASEWKKTVRITAKLYNKDNIADWETWDQKLSDIG